MSPSSLVGRKTGLLFSWRCPGIKARPQFDHVAVGVAHKYRDVAVTEGHRTLRDGGPGFLQNGDGVADVGDAKSHMRKARVLFRHIHEDVLAACAVDAVDDEVQLDPGRILDDHDGVEIDFVLDFKPKLGIEGQRARFVGHPDAEMVDLLDDDHGCHILSQTGCAQDIRTNSLPLLPAANPEKTSLTLSQFLSFLILASQRATFG